MKKILILVTFFLSTLVFGQTQAEKDLLWGMSGIWNSDVENETIVVDLVNQVKVIGPVEIKIKEINTEKKYVIFLIGDIGVDSVIKLEYEVDRLTERTIKKLIIRFGNKTENLFSLVKDFGQLQKERRSAEEQRKQNEIEQTKAEELRIIEQKKAEELELKKEEEIKKIKEKEENEKTLVKEKEINERSKIAEEVFLTGFANIEDAKNIANKISAKNLEIEASLKNGITIMIDQGQSKDESFFKIDEIFFENLLKGSRWKLQVQNNDIFVIENWEKNRTHLEYFAYEYIFTLRPIFSGQRKLFYLNDLTKLKVASKIIDINSLKGTSNTVIFRAGEDAIIVCMGANVCSWDLIKLRIPRGEYSKLDLDFLKLPIIRLKINQIEFQKGYEKLVKKFNKKYDDSNKQWQLLNLCIFIQFKISKDGDISNILIPELAEQKEMYDLYKYIIENMIFEPCQVNGIKVGASISARFSIQNSNCDFK